MDQAKVGKFISVLRKERGLTQEALGEKLGVTNKTVSRWENGNYMPDIELLVPLGEALGVSVNELLAGERLDDEQFRKQADKNLVKAVRESAFTVEELEEQIYSGKMTDAKTVAAILAYARKYLR